jgi:membrane-bound inhibitor of C-type lysozyme
MSKTSNTIVIIAIIMVILVAGIFIWLNWQNSQPAENVPQKHFVALALYTCTDGKTIKADFYDSPSSAVPVPGQPPIPTGSVELVLSDGRQVTLPQAISGSGIRYANSDESLIFWNEGNGAFILENNQQTYTGCIRTAADPGNLPQVFESGTEGFSIRYPEGYTINTDYKYQEIGPGKDISGVSFTIPSSVTEGTNLSQDAYISVEEIPQTLDCSASLFFGSGASAPETQTDQGVTYSVASETGAGAGNRYEETVYAISGTNPCVAVRYFIHYGVIENYPEGAVQEFDKQALLSQFDEIRRTLIIGQ